MRVRLFCRCSVGGRQPRRRQGDDGGQGTGQAKAGRRLTAAQHGRSGRVAGSGRVRGGRVAGPSFCGECRKGRGRGLATELRAPSPRQGLFHQSPVCPPGTSVSSRGAGARHTHGVRGEASVARVRGVVMVTGDFLGRVCSRGCPLRLSPAAVPCASRLPVHLHFYPSVRLFDNCSQSTSCGRGAVAEGWGYRGKWGEPLTSLLLLLDATATEGPAWMGR